MANAGKPPEKRRKKVTFQVSTRARPDFDHPLNVLVFDPTGAFLERAEVKEGKVALSLSEEEVSRARFFVTPRLEEGEDAEITPARLEKLGAYRPVLRAASSGGLPGVIEVPGPVLDFWPYCFCWVRGKVVRSLDGLPVCNARVHICEVDRIPIWIEKLPDPDILRLRDELLDALREPRPPFPPDPIPDPPGPLPGPDPLPFRKPLIRLGAAVQANPMSLPRPMPLALSVEAPAKLASASPTLARQALVSNWKLLLPYLCLWPWWWRFRCDEVAVVTTGPGGRFQHLMGYPCGGDHPDLYFWVEYDFGAGPETVHRPPMACWTHWNYPCGNEVVIRVADPRLPACDGELSPEGKQVWVMSVGRKVSIGEIYTDVAGALEGMVREDFGKTEQDYAFGGKLEPRVWFGRADLIADGITHYLWSVRPLGGAETEWRPLDRQVIRHYTTGAGTAPVDVMGPEASGANAGHFKIRPVSPPAGGIEWVVGDEREDLAAAHFVTRPPPVPDPFPACGVADPDAGKYELKMELFDASGTRIAWEDHGIILRIATSEAPFGDDPFSTQVASDYHRVKDGSGKTIAFRMVLHVDNSRSGATIDAIGGTDVMVNPDCGVVTLVGPNPALAVGFDAGRPGGLARFDFDTERGLSHDIAQASAAGGVAEAAVNGFTRSLPCHFSKSGISASTFLETCSQAAFSEHLRVWALSQDGYGRLYHLDAYDVAAFMLTEPCPPCPPCEGAPGQGVGQGQGRGRGQGQGQGGA